MALQRPRAAQSLHSDLDVFSLRRTLYCDPSYLPNFKIVKKISTEASPALGIDQLYGINSWPSVHKIQLDWNSASETLTNLKDVEFSQFLSFVISFLPKPPFPATKTNRGMMMLNMLVLTMSSAYLWITEMASREVLL